MVKLTLKDGTQLNIDVQENKYGGGAHVVIVDDAGVKIPGGYLLLLKPSGFIYREKFINDHHGLKLNDNGQIRLAKH